MSLPADTKHPVVVTGALGGLGSATALCLLERGHSVLGVDNLDPGAASPVHFAWQLNLLKQHPNFRFLATDLRSLTLDDLSPEGSPLPILVHCAAITPYRLRPTPTELIHEINRDAAFHLLELAKNANVERVLLPQHLSLADNDPRANDTAWVALLEAEDRVRQWAKDDPRFLFLPLPTLVGPGQSLRTPPVSPLLQTIARVLVHLPSGAGPVTLAALQDTALLLCNLCDLDNKSILYDIASSLPVATVSLDDLLAPLLEKTGLTLEPASTHSPAWGSIYPTNGATGSLELSPLLDSLFEWLLQLPHVPPADWPEVPARERRLMRSRRRRQKRNRQSGQGNE